jgi:hypothetical protein
MDTLKNLTMMQWIGISIGLNSLFMGATPQLTVLFGVNAVPYIVAIATLGNGALGVFVTVIGGQAAMVSRAMSSASGQDALIRSVLSMPGVENMAVNGKAGAALATLAVDQTVEKISPTPAAMDKVTAIAAIAKAAAVVLVAVILSTMAFAPTPALAQTSAPQANAVLTAAQTQVYAALNSIVGFAGGFVQADLNAAIADAQAQTPPNAQAVSCWQAIAKIPVTAIPTGAGLAYLKQKFLDLQSLYMPLNLNCGSVAPLFLKEYNQFMSMAASQNL